MRGEVKDGGRYSLVKNKINYGFTKNERFLETVFGILKLGIIGYIFYKSIIGIVLLELLLPLYLKIKEEEYTNKHIQELKVENRLTILIGPERDFSTADIEQLSTLGIRAVTLGSQRLRTETAGVYAAAFIYSKMK